MRLVLMHARKIRAVVDKEVPFEKTNDALTNVERDHVKGKVVVKMK